jgi:hypothetical protein
MVEVFERYGVSFVSVTQQFNTTTSMGRLMLNVLLSFAQFEREVTGERIRDKIAAAKRKGMWMGGVPPLGYDVDNRRLVPNEREAKLIPHIFQRFVELSSRTALVKELKLDGVTSKAWTTQDGKTRDGRPIDKGNISMRSWPPMTGCAAMQRGRPWRISSRGSSSATMVAHCRRGPRPRRMAAATGTTFPSVTPRNTLAPRVCRDCLPQNSSRRCLTSCVPSFALRISSVRCCRRQTRPDPGQSQDHRGHDPARGDLGSTVPGGANPRRRPATAG